MVSLNRDQSELLMDKKRIGNRGSLWFLMSGSKRLRSVLASLFVIPVMVIFSVVIISSVSLIALKYGHVDLIQDDPEQPIINLGGL
jgi:hypothetical protein